MARSGDSWRWACLNAQDNDYAGYLLATHTGIPPTLGASALSSVLLGMAVAVMPTATGAPPPWRRAGLASGVAVALLAGFVLSPPDSPWHPLWQGLASLPVLCAPAFVVGRWAACLGRLAHRAGSRRRWWPAIAGMAAAGTSPLPDEWVSTVLTRSSPHDTAPGAGAVTAVDALVLAISVAWFALRRGARPADVRPATSARRSDHRSPIVRPLST